MVLLMGFPYLDLLTRNIGRYSKTRDFGALFDTVDGSEIRLTTWDGAKNPVNKGINNQPQLVSRMSSINSSGMCNHPCL